MEPEPGVEWMRLTRHLGTQVEEVAYQLQHLLSANLESAKKRENQDVVTIEFPEEDVLGRKEYFGEIYQDLRSGLGVMYWHDGTIYQGQWLNDMVHILLAF